MIDNKSYDTIDKMDDSIIACKVYEEGEDALIKASYNCE